MYYTITLRLEESVDIDYIIDKVYEAGFEDSIISYKLASTDIDIEGYTRSNNTTKIAKAIDKKLNTIQEYIVDRSILITEE